MSEPILSVKNVSKSYGRHEALRGVSFTIEKGQILGLLGPNGSGKTTLIKIINTLITNYSGEIKICGEPPGASAKAHISYLPDVNFLRRELTVADTFKIFKNFFADFDTDKARGLLSVIKLKENQRIGTLSKGMTEKLTLALIMARRARLYIFDEPIAGVDPAAREFILEIITGNYNEDGAVLFATHLISEAEQILNRVVFIRDGRVVLDDFTDRIRKNKTVNELFKEEFKC